MIVEIVDGVEQKYKQLDISLFEESLFFYFLKICYDLDQNSLD